MGFKEKLLRDNGAIAKGLVKGLEESIIEDIKNMHPHRYVLNVHQSNSRKLKRFFGFFEYPLAQLYDKETKRTIVPLKERGFLAKYRQYTDEALE